MSQFLRTAAEVEMGYQPVAYDGRSAMRALIAEMREIERRDRRVTRRQWVGLARRYVRAKWSMLEREMTMRPPRGGSGETRRGGARRPSDMRL